MALLQRSSLEQLDKDVQFKLIEVVAQMDKHAFENAQQSLVAQSDTQAKEIADRALGRKHVLVFVGAIGVLAILAGTVVTVMLIVEKQYPLAHTVMMSCLGVGGALLGGAGLTTVLQKLSGGGH